jgi:hypothetical protein
MSTLWGPGESGRASYPAGEEVGWIVALVDTWSRRQAMLLIAFL